MAQIKVNLNDLAKEISKIEHGEINLSIAEIKEVLSCLGLILARMRYIDAFKVLNSLIVTGKDYEYTAPDDPDD